MPRIDYDEIKGTFEKFLNCWKTTNIHSLDECFVPYTACYLSTVSAYPCGSQHSIYGIRDFVAETPKPDEFHISHCNYVARIADDIAQQSSIAVCRVAKYGENDSIKTYEFSAQFSNSWEKTERGWRICELRMDIVEASGDYTEFVENWYFDKMKSGWYLGVHLPVISGELDSPWERIPDAESLLTDEEQILESFSRYAFGIDTASFSNLSAVFSKYLTVNMAPWGAMDRREFMETLKYQRLPSRYWIHPVKAESIDIQGDISIVRLYRMAGHKQRSHPLILTKDNVNMEHACARYEIEMRKENGCWKIFKFNYFLGIIDIGEFEDIV